MFPCFLFSGWVFWVWLVEFKKEEESKETNLDFCLFEL